MSDLVLVLGGGACVAALSVVAAWRDKRRAQRAYRARERTPSLYTSFGTADREFLGDGTSVVHGDGFIAALPRDDQTVTFSGVFHYLPIAQQPKPGDVISAVNIAGQPDGCYLITSAVDGNRADGTIEYKAIWLGPLKEETDADGT